jgi:hypothetical protein
MMFQLSRSRAFVLRISAMCARLAFLHHKDCKRTNGASTNCFRKNGVTYMMRHAEHATVVSGQPKGCNSTFAGADGTFMDVLMCCSVILLPCQCQHLARYLTLLLGYIAFLPLWCLVRSQMQCRLLGNASKAFCGNPYVTNGADLGFLILCRLR